jgi:signal transduction histidine kinase
MTSDWWTARRRPGAWTTGDLSLAVVVVCLLVTEIVPNPDMTPQVLLVLLAVAMAVPFAWRSAHPVVVALLVSLAHVAMSGAASGPFAPQTAVLPLIVVLFSAAAGSRGAVSLIAGTITLALTVVAWVISVEGHVDDFWPWMLWAGAWVSGTIVRRRGDTAAQHSRRAAVLEVEARTAAVASAQRERDRIARELHDVVAHSVSVMVVQAGAERLRIGGGGRTVEVLEAIEEAGRVALTELRGMLGVMRHQDAPEDGRLPSLHSIPALIDRVRATGLEIELTVLPEDIVSLDDPATAAQGLAAYRIIQEALTNVVRHAGPVRTGIEVRSDQKALTVRIRNGPSGSPDAITRGSGWGVFGMRERAAALGGELSAGPTADGGYEVQAVLPLRAVSGAR